MNCSFDQEKLSGYYDGELDAAEKAEVERHIASCSECLRELGELKSAALMVRELPKLRAPRSLAEEVAKELRPAAPTASFSRMRRAMLWATAAAAGVFILINVKYFVELPKSAAPVAASSPAPTVAVGSPELAKAPTAPERKQLGDPEADRQAAAPAESRAANSADALKKAEAGPEQNHQKEQAAAAAKRDDAKPAMPAPGAPPPAPATPAPVVVPDAPKAEAKAFSAPAAEESERSRRELAPKSMAAKDAAPDASTLHFTVAAIQLAKGRARLDEALRKLDVAIVPAPAPRPAAKAKSAEPQVVVDLSEAQLARLKAEFEKQPEMRLLSGAPEDPKIATLRGGGLALTDAKKVASEGAMELAKPKAAADEAPSNEKSGAPPRRRIVIHVLEVPTLPAEAPPAAEAVSPAKK